MKINMGIYMSCALLIMCSAVFATADARSDGAVGQSWTIKTLDNDEPGIMNLSAGFLNGDQIPFLIYSRAAPNYRVYLVHLATETSAHNCGPGNSWTCEIMNPNFYLYEGVLSKAATFSSGGTSSIAYAYQTVNQIYIAVFRQDFDSNMTAGTNENLNLIELDSFGGIHYELVGVPTLTLEGTHYKAAVVVRNQDTNLSSLVYAYYNPGTSSPCKPGSEYQCDVITTITGTGSTPSLSYVGDTAGIAYYNPETDDLMYAYPHAHSVTYPSNCGPGDPKTYRCITIYSADEVGSNLQLAFGASSSQRAIAFTREYLLGTALYAAVYVSRDGNCGSDKNMLGQTVQKWQCTNLGSLNNHPSTAFSITIDPDGYPVIAYDNAQEEYAPISLYVTYPNERTGLGTGWMAQKLDGAPSTSVETGGQASLALNGGGLGFAGYLQKEEYENPTLKFALQENFSAFLPIVSQ